MDQHRMRGLLVVLTVVLGLANIGIYNAIL